MLPSSNDMPIALWTFRSHANLHEIHKRLGPLMSAMEKGGLTPS